MQVLGDASFGSGSFWSLLKRALDEDVKSVTLDEVITGVVRLQAAEVPWSVAHGVGMWGHGCMLLRLREGRGVDVGV